MTSLNELITFESGLKIDSRLKRIIFTTQQPELLSNVVNRTFMTASEGFDVNQPNASMLMKRVLVKLNGKAKPSDFEDLVWSHIVDETYTVSIPLTQLEHLASAKEVEILSAGNRLGLALNTSVSEVRGDEVRAGTGVTSRTGKGVLVGIIDFGFDYTLDDFRDSNGDSRIEFFWNQQITANGSENTPANFPYGVEYSREKIDTAIAAQNPFIVVRHNDPGRQPLGIEEHGTHVAGIAVGNGRSSDSEFPAGQYVGVAPEARIVFVQPDAGDQDSTFTDSVHVADAIEYILERADELEMPCVINMSLGQNGGSHDGESVVERAIDRLLLVQPGRAMVVAAGNEHIWRGHASGDLATGATRVLNWRFGGNMPIPGGGATGSGIDRTSNEMEIWYSSRDRFRVRVTDPNGDSTPFLDPGQTIAPLLPSGDRVFIDSVRFSPLNGDAQIYVEIIPAPALDPFSPPQITRGAWEVELESIESRDGHFDAWIERDFRDPNNNFADQSFFVGSDFDPVITLGTPATNLKAVAVANYNHVTQSANSSSSRGPTRDGRQKPEVAAPGTNIFSSNSLGGRRPPGFGTPVPVRFSTGGTSMSAPHVAGIVALMLEAKPDLTVDQIRKILIASARPPFPSTSTAFDNAFGYGRVDAVEAVKMAEALL